MTDSTDLIPYNLRRVPHDDALRFLAAIRRTDWTYLGLLHDHAVTIEAAVQDYLESNEFPLDDLRDLMPYIIATVDLAVEETLSCISDEYWANE